MLPTTHFPSVLFFLPAWQILSAISRPWVCLLSPIPLPVLSFFISLPSIVIIPSQFFSHTVILHPSSNFAIFTMSYFTSTSFPPLHRWSIVLHSLRSSFFFPFDIVLLRFFLRSPISSRSNVLLIYVYRAPSVISFHLFQILIPGASFHRSFSSLPWGFAGRRACLVFPFKLSSLLEGPSLEVLSALALFSDGNSRLSETQL